MKDATVRLARHDDIEQLVEMRRDFTFEDFDGPALTRPEYEEDCRRFLGKVIASGTWQLWVAEISGGLSPTPTWC
jgi:hypothetical protein